MDNRILRYAVGCILSLFLILILHKSTCIFKSCENVNKTFALNNNDDINNNITNTKSRITRSISSNLSNPLIYTKLRFQNGYLQFIRNYQKYLTYDEKKVVQPMITRDYFNQTKTKQVVYYESEEYERSAFNRKDAIIETIDRIYLSKILHYDCQRYDKAEDRKKSSDPKLVNEQKCYSEVNLLLEKLDQLLSSGSQELIDVGSQQFFDSFGTSESGYLIGNTVWLGHWKDCYKQHTILTNFSKTPYSFKGRHCVASLRDPNWEKVIDTKIIRVRNKEKPYYKYSGQEYDYARFFRYQVGFCLPESCDSNLVETRKQEVLKLASFKLEEPFNSYDLYDLFCLPDEGSPLRMFDFEAWLFILFAGIWVLLLIFTTIIDVVLTKAERNDKSKAKKLMPLRMVFSLVSNYKRFLSTSSSKKNYRKLKAEVEKFEKGIKSTATPTPDLQLFNGIKAFSTPVILLSHCTICLYDLQKYTLDLNLFDYRLTYDIGITAPFIVDWFFFVTGFITAYLVFANNSVNKNTPIHWIYSIFRRYWRLMPTYVILFWFMRSIFKHIGSGPNWDYGTYNITVRSICKEESWIYPLTMTSNLHPLHEECIMPSWYASVDMQLFIITPLLLIALAKSALFGWILNLSIIFGCILLRFHFYWTNPRAHHLDLMRPKGDLVKFNNWDLHQSYIYTHYRISAYVVGLLAGHYVYMVLKGKWTSFMYVPDYTKIEPSSSKSSNGSSKVISAPIEMSQVCKSKPEVLEKEEEEEEDQAVEEKEKKKKEEEEEDEKQEEEKIDTVIDDIEDSVPSSYQERKGRFFRTAVFWLGVYFLLSLQASSTILRSLPEFLDVYSKVMASSFYSTDHTMVSLGLALITVTLLLGQYPTIRLIMSHPMCTVLSRLSYMVFIIQIEVIYFFIQTSEYTMEKTTFDQSINMFNVFIITFTLGFILVPCLEMPLITMEKILSQVLFKPKQSPNRTKEGQRKGQEVSGGS